MKCSVGPDCVLVAEVCRGVNSTLKCSAALSLHLLATTGVAEEYYVSPARRQQAVSGETTVMAVVRNSFLGLFEFSYARPQSPHCS